MKIAVLAANGRTGQYVVDELLKAGHHVKAGVHRHNSLEAHEGLEVVSCDATDLKAVEQLMQGCDAVVSLIGHVRGSRADVQTAAIMNVVRAARRTKVQRVVSLTGNGVRFPGDKTYLLDLFLNTGIKLLDSARIQDGIDHVEVLKASDLNWTVLRVLKLTGGKAGAFSLLLHGPAKLMVPRAEVAQAVRQVLEGATFIKQAPLLSKDIPS